MTCGLRSFSAATGSGKKAGLKDAGPIAGSGTMLAFWMLRKIRPEDSVLNEFESKFTKEICACGA